MTDLRRWSVTLWTRFARLQRFSVWLLLVLALLAIRLPLLGKILYDDSFITFRYAKNLVEHGQFVFNLGENVLATTTPLYAGILSGLYALRLPLPEAAGLLNMAFEAALLWVLIGIVGIALAARGQSGSPPTGGVTNLAYVVVGGLAITNQAMSFASSGGMETALFTLLNAATLLCTLRRAYLAGSALGALATLTRPDGIFALLALGVAVLIRERRLPIREALVSLAIGLPWVVIAQVGYGSFIPHSVTAKDAIAPIWPMTVGLKLQILFYNPLRVFGVFAWSLASWAAYRLVQAPYRRTALPILLFTALHLVYAFLPNNLGFDWYFVPLQIMLSVLAGLGLALLFTPTGAPAHLRWRIGAGAVYTLALLAAIPYTALGNHLLALRQDQIHRQGMLAAVDYLEAHVPAGKTVQSDSIGILGFYTDYRVLDVMALASPEVMPLVASADCTDSLMLSAAATFEPPYIVTWIAQPYPGYRVAARFETPTIPFLVYEHVE
ncbi:MAG: hypothetical protein IT323_05625 [Anaerolineae bacterium]|nr:hypothetical protein [Anaerolineae bacterium]